MWENIYGVLRYSRLASLNIRPDYNAWTRSRKYWCHLKILFISFDPKFKENLYVRCEVNIKMSLKLHRLRNIELRRSDTLSQPTQCDNTDTCSHRQNLTEPCRAMMRSWQSVTFILTALARNKKIISGQSERLTVKSEWLCFGCVLRDLWVLRPSSGQTQQHGFNEVARVGVRVEGEG